MDIQIIDRFKLFQNDTGEFMDLNIESVLFDQLSYSNRNTFKFVKGQNKYVQTYITNNPGDIAELGSSLINECISSYVVPIDDEDVVSKICVSFNKDNAKGSRAFYRDYPFVMDRHHIAIIPDTNFVNVKYFQKCLDQFLILKKYGWGDNVATTDEISKYFLPIPKKINDTYTSLVIQEALVRFLEYYENKNKEQLEYINLALFDIGQIEELFFPLFFSSDKSISLRFDKFCKNKSINLKFKEIEFESKRILSDKDNDLVCNKRMGFTPIRDSEGDLSWFTVRDLTANAPLFIDIPSTKEKTTIDLIKKSIQESSSKFPPIKKGDVLVSFKLTVGTTKVYNSDIPSYCNEAIDILTPRTGINSEYLAYNCLNEYKKYGTKTNNGITLNDDHKKQIEIKVPIANDKFSSIELQNILVDFVNEYLNKLISIKADIKQLESLFTEYNQAIMHKTFV